jgi:hypothetical protein
MQRDNKIDLDNALLDCIKDAMKKGTDPSLKQALKNELGEEPEQDDGPEWI